MTGSIGGYEYGITCPKCDYYTRITCYDDPNEGIECGEDWSYSDDHGCGRTLRVQVEVVENDDHFGNIPPDEAMEMLPDPDEFAAGIHGSVPTIDEVAESSGRDPEEIERILDETIFADDADCHEADGDSK